jgi:predicted MFS family arabinose efflux permease
MDAYRTSPTADRSPWRAPRYAAYIAAATTGRVADSMWLGVVLLVLARTHDAGLAGAIVAAATLPTLVSAPLLGAWLDVTAHRRASLAANQVGLIVCLAALLMLVGHAPAAVVLGVAALAGLGQPLVNGGFSSMMPALVPERALPRANACESISYGLADVAGPALAGALAAALGAPAALAGQIVLAAACLALLAVMPPAAPPSHDRPPDLRRALAAGLGLLARTPALRGVTTASLLGSVSFGLLTVALPALAARLTGDASAAGGLYAAIAAGAIGGAALLPRLDGRIAPERLVYAGGAAQGLLLVALGALPVSAGDVVLCVACGVPQGLALAGLFAVRIECTPPGMRAQVFTSAAGMKAGFGAAGAAASGVLVAAHGAGLALAVAGAGLVAASAAGMLAARGPAPRARARHLASSRRCRSTTTAAGSATSASTSSPATPT